GRTGTSSLRTVTLNSVSSVFSCFFSVSDSWSVSSSSLRVSSLFMGLSVVTGYLHPSYCLFRQRSCDIQQVPHRAQLAELHPLLDDVHPELSAQPERQRDQRE